MENQIVARDSSKMGRNIAYMHVFEKKNSLFIQHKDTYVYTPMNAQDVFKNSISMHSVALQTSAISKLKKGMQSTRDINTHTKSEMFKLFDIEFSSKWNGIVTLAKKWNENDRDSE